MPTETQIDANGNPAPPLHFANHGDIGATWGEGWNRTDEVLYFGAFMKVHTGFGPSGPGAIYQMPIDPNTGAHTTPSLFANLATDGYTVCNDPHGVDVNASSPAPDDTAIAAVGRCGLGDLDISDDDTTLYVVNLTSREIVAYDTGTANAIDDWTFPLDQDTLSASNGYCADPAVDMWPFALEWHNNSLYVGATCTAMSSGDPADLWGYVYRLNPVTGQFTLVLDWDILAENTNFTFPITEWRNTWADLTAAPASISGTSTVGQLRLNQPWLTDIEFFGEDLVLGMRDRLGDQTGANIPNTTNVVINSGGNNGVVPPFMAGLATGDIVCAAQTGPDQYSIEDADTGQCGSRIPGQVAIGETGEFYADGGGLHYDVSNAGLELVPGFPLLQSITNPTELLNLSRGIYNTGGLEWVDAADGHALRGYHLYARVTV